MREKAQFYYGRLRAEIRHVGQMDAPPLGGRGIRLWDIILHGPGNLEQTFYDWSGMDEEPDVRLLGGMVRTLIIGLEFEVCDPEALTDMVLAAGSEIIGLEVADARFGPYLPGAAAMARADDARIRAGGSPKRSLGGPKDWWPRNA